jgi:hypothetical protein
MSPARLVPSKIVVAIAGLAMVGGSLSPSTAHAAVLTLVPSFSRDEAGEGATLTDSLTIAGSEYHGRPEPLTNLAVHLPAGVGGSTTGFATCTASTLEMTGGQGCPPGSSAGPEGHVTMLVAFGNEFVLESASILSFFGSNNEVELFVAGHTPVALELIMKGTYTADSAPFGQVFDISMPLVETVPGAPDASTTALTLSLGVSSRQGSTEFNSVSVPRECPPGGYPWAADATFDNTTTAEARATSPCLPTPAPLLGRRQTVEVTAGVVTVRLKGTNTFVPLTGESTIPDGSELDTTAGRAVVTGASTTPQGAAASAEVYGGRLVIHQESAHAGETHLTLSSPLARCPGIRASHSFARRLASQAKRSSGSKSRHLWVAEQGGSWGTNGRYVSTTVEGTRWLTLDECNRSEVTVASGRVRVHDLIHNVTRILTAGQSYVASRRPHTRAGRR